MKKRLISVLLLVLVLVVNAGCADDSVTTESDTYIDLPSEEVSDTIESDTVSEDLTETQTLSKGPLFDTSEFSDIEVPAVIDALNYEKYVEYPSPDGGYGANNLVKIPKIDSDKPGAVAFNQKLYSEFVVYIDNINTENSPYIYKVTYDYSDYDGIIFIRIKSGVALAYSEGAAGGDYFYYDSVNDRELTAEEYLAHFGLDGKELDMRARWDIGYTFFEGIEADHLRYSEELFAIDDSAFIDEIPENTLVFAQSQNENTPLGYKVSEEGVSVFYAGMGLSRYVSEIRIDVTSGESEKLMFAAKSDATGVLDDTSVREEVGAVVTFDNGRIESFLVKDGIPFERVIVSNDQVYVFYNQQSLNTRSYIEINGEKASYSAGYTVDTDTQVVKLSYRFVDDLKR